MANENNQQNLTINPRVMQKYYETPVTNSGTSNSSTYLAKNNPMVIQKPYIRPIEQQNSGYTASGAPSMDIVSGTPNPSSVSAAAKPTSAQTTYIDPDGKQQTGYIVDGVTYTDEAGTTRVPVGSTVNTSDGAYIRTEDGSVRYEDYLAAQKSGSGLYQPESGAPYVDELSAAQLEAALQALKTAYDYNVNVMNAAKEKIPAEYQSARNQTAAQSAIGKSNWNEYAAASGLSSGAGGQAALAHNNVLQSNLSSISTAESDAMADLDLQLTQLETQYQNDIARAIADGSLAKAEMLYEDYLRVQEALYKSSLDQANLDLNYDSLTASTNASDQSNSYSIYQMLAQLGQFSWLSELGFSAEEIAEIEGRYNELYGLS